MDRPTESVLYRDLLFPFFMVCLCYLQDGRVFDLLNCTVCQCHNGQTHCYLKQCPKVMCQEVISNLMLAFSVISALNHFAGTGFSLAARHLL